MTMEKPFSQACDNNKGPILALLQRHFAEPGRILEIGSGTGQHAVHFARNLPHLLWQPSDLAANHPAIDAWMRDYPAENLLRPLVLEVAAGPWPDTLFDGAFSANTLHIMAWSEVLALFDGVSTCLRPGARLLIYGPFNYDGRFTSDSNAQFDAWLRQQAPHRAIRDVEAVCEAAAARGLSLVEDNPMPANNRTLVFEKT